MSDVVNDTGGPKRRCGWSCSKPHSNVIHMHDSGVRTVEVELMVFLTLHSK
jgi:hypothetical protein